MFLVILVVNFFIFISYIYLPGLFPFGFALRSLVGLTGLGLGVDLGTGAGTYLVVVSMGVEGRAGLTEGTGGVYLVVCPELTVGI